MDPNTNLEEQRSLVKWIFSHPLEDTSVEAHRLAELVEALDQWLSVKKGCFPEAWKYE